MANYTKLKVIWKNNLNNIYKDNTIIGVGQEAVINMDENGISNIYVNFKVNDDFFTDLVKINGNVIQVPFKTDVLKAGTHQLEIVAYLKNGDVVPSPTFSYYVEKSLKNTDDIKADTHYPVLIELLEKVEEWNEKIPYQEEQRIANENERKSNEINRQSNENTRQSNEIERQEREDIRQSNESTRISKEAERLAEEVNRVEAEASRVTAENSRIEAENVRAEFYEGFNDRLDAVDSQLAHNTTQLEHNIKREIGIINNLKNSYNIKLVEHEFNVNRLDFKTLLTPTTNTNNWTVENGVLSSNLSTLNFAIFNNTMCDGTIEFTCLNPKSSSWFGALVGYDDVKNNALVVMIKNNYLEYWRIQGDEFQPLGLNTVYLGDDVRTSIIDDVPVNIRIERRGNLVGTYINDKLISNEEESFFSNLRYKNGIVANNDNNFSFTNLLVNEYLFNNSFKINDGMCIGTSITHGINQDVKWVDLFNQKIKDNIMFSDDVILRNEGRSGFTSEEILGILPTVYTNYSDTLDYINIEVGMNDLKNTNKLTSDDTIDNIRKMIHFCKQRNLNCTVTTITPLLEGYGTVGGEPMWEGGYKQCFDTNTKIRKLCLLENIRCIDNAKSFNNLSIEELKNIIDDGVHPNGIGAEIMAETAIKTLIGCLY